MNCKVILPCAVIIFAGRILCAQEAEAPASAETNDLRAIRQSLQQQSRQIEALTQQVARLSQLIEGAHPTPAAVPAQAVAPESSVAPPPAAEVPKAEPVESGSATHVVAKGETLTSIAKHYRITVGSLLKMNKITDDRKLQIGQALIIPPPKNPENPPPQTENP